LHINGPERPHSSIKGHVPGAEWVLEAANGSGFLGCFGSFEGLKSAPFFGMFSITFLNGKLARFSPVKNEI
jgi:hypothetical protein